MNKVQFEYSGLDEAFPPIDAGVKPFGSRVLCQIRLAKKKTKGGIILTGDTKDTETWNTQVAKVVAVGDLAFKNRNTQEPWPEARGLRRGTSSASPSTAVTSGRSKSTTIRK
jgi:hypothetical protein